MEDQVSKAFALVSKEFEGKKDKAGDDYLNHLMRVSAKQLSSTRRCVALLHDLMEDIPDWTPKRLREHGFEWRVIDAVELLTHRPGVPYEDYINLIKTDPIATAVKIADLEDNMDLTRLPELTDDDIRRLKKYHAAYLQLKKND